MQYASLFFLAGFLLWSPEAPQSEGFADRLQAHYRTVTTIQADFTQHKESALFEEPLTSKGKFYFSKPDQIRWEQVSPTASYFILDGKGVIQFDGKSTKKSTGGNAQLNVFREFILKTVDGSILKDPNFRQTYTPGPGIMEVHLEPLDRRMAKRLDAIQLVFDGKTLLLERLKLVESNGETTEITFLSQQLNAPISPALFQ